jgi:hypothetical protein
MVFFLIFTVLYHISFNAAFDPLLYNLPKSLEAEEESLRADLEVGNSDPALKEKNGQVIELASAPHKKPNFITKFLKPQIFADFATLRRLVPNNLLDADNLYEESVEKNAYYPPSVSSETPLLWIPRDEGGISRQEVAHTSRVIPITDEGCTFNEKNKIDWDQEGARPPLWQPKIYY